MGLVNKILNEAANIDSIITSIVRNLLFEWEEEYNIDPKDISFGDCDKFADDLKEKLAEQGITSVILNSHMFHDKWDKKYDLDLAKKYGKVPENFIQIGLAEHYWVYVPANNKHYDSDNSKGVNDMFQLPLYKRYYRHYNKK